MNFFSDIYGNHKQKAYFSSLIKEGKYAHAYILEAPQGAGKKMFAKALAATLASHTEKDNAEETSKKCRRILDGTSPDVMLLTREEGKKTIGVERVRDFCGSVFLTPSELNFKMYIFDEADCITPQAQNALLKIIEEPPAGVYMLLLCENSLSLLSTVRSRAQKISLERFDAQALRAYAEKYGLFVAGEEEKLSFAVRMAGGSVGKLKMLLDEDSFAFSVYSMAKKIIEGQAAKNRSVSYFDFLRQITDFVTTREALDALTENLLLAYGDLARIKNAEESTSLFFERDEAETVSMQFAMEAVSKSFAITDAVRTDMKWNTSVAVSAAVLAMELWAAV
jgi:DNA polymerase-3 subunit delta'